MKSKNNRIDPLTALTIQKAAKTAMDPADQLQYLTKILNESVADLGSGDVWPDVNLNQKE